MNEPSTIADAPAPNPAPQPVPTPEKTGVKHALFAGIGVVVLVVLCLLAWAVARSRPSAPAPQPSPSASSTAGVTPTVTNGEDTASSTLRIDWHLGQIVEARAAFPGALDSDTFVVDATVDAAFDETASTTTVRYRYAFYDHGVVKDGPYQGQTVYSGILVEGGGIMMGINAPSTPERLTLLRAADGTVRAVGAGVTDLLPTWRNKVVAAPNLRVELSAFPGQLVLENGKIVKRQIGNGLSGAFQAQCDSRHCADRLPVARTTDGLALFTAPLKANFIGMIGTGAPTDPPLPGCLVFYREDGSGAIYESVIPSNSKTGTGEALPAPQVGDDELTWDAPYTNTSTFRTHLIGGCGGWSCPEVLNGEEFDGMDIREGDLVQAGHIAAGDPVYVLRTALNARSGNYFRPIQRAYDNWWYIDPVTQQKPPIAEFLRKQAVPLFFWKDALGRWVVYTNTFSVPLAECGKPVVYLYPTRPTDIRVTLPAFINVTKSEPAYPKDGWTVRATNDGTLTTTDGKTWSSLFWEGTGVTYPVPNTGFVVKKADAETFLRTTLPKYGLNAQETKDFLDFWLPQMTGAPYLRLSFLTDDWSKSAPLTVSPRPATQIRLFMDWQKLAAPISLPEPTITTPARTGYTLVEWGGLLR